MKYFQHNPVPLPSFGASQSVKTTMDSVFDWKYALEEQGLMALYEKGKAASWNAVDLDWSTEVNIEKIMTERQVGGMGSMLNTVLNPPRKLDDREQLELNLNMNAFMLS